jgi:diamine N-acetyltransferase
MISFRTPTPADASALSHLGITTFREAFAHLYKPEDLAHYEAQSHGVSRIEDQLRSTARLYRVAEADGGMVGYCKIGFDKTLDHYPGDRRVMELSQLYVLQNRLGSGVGPALMTWAIEEARARAFDDIILSVYSENLRAQRFYQRYGFRYIADTYFMVGQHRDDEHLYALSLTA